MTTTSQRRSARHRHIPQRTCIGCLQTRPKRELIRIVRTTSGAVEVDPTGKRSGRGAYLCKARACWEAGLKRERLERALRMKVAPQNREGLYCYAQTLPGDGDS